MESARKRSASAAHLPPFSMSTKKRQPYQPSPPRKTSPVKITSFESRLSTSGLRTGWFDFNYMPLSMRSEPSLAKTQDSPEGHANQYTTSTVRPHLNRTNPTEKDNALPASSPLEDPEDHRISLPPSQDQESSTGSPVPSIPSTPRLSTAESPLSLHKNSYFESVTGSDRSTPVSVAVHKRGVRKPFVKEGFRYRVHPLKNQHDREKKAELSMEIYRIKLATGYTQDIGTYRGYLSYRERVEQFLTAADENAPLPQTAGPESIPPYPSINYLHRAIRLAKITMNSPRPAVPRFNASEHLAKQIKARDEEIERRLRPKLPGSLPPEQEKVVQGSFGNRSFLAKAAREQVGPSDLTRLKPGQWLNDEIINFYGAMISERAAKFEEDSAKGVSGKSAEGSTSSTNGKEKNNNYPGMEGVGDPLKVHVFNTFFLAKLQEQGYDKGKLGKWTKKVDIFSKDLVLIPCNLGNSHWTCAAINFRDKRVEYYDSLGMDRPAIKHMLRTYLDKEHQDKKKAPFSFDGWTDFFSEETPQQENGFDCGVFLCQTMENLSRGVPVPFDFTQANMPYLRRRMVWEITQQKLPISRI